MLKTASSTQVEKPVKSPVQVKIEKAASMKHNAALKALTDVLVARSNLASYLGKSFDGDRDLYKQLGYYNTLTYDQLNGKFIRGDIARRLVTAYPDATWRLLPEVTDGDSDDTTPFESAWVKLTKQPGLNVNAKLKRADICCGIGTFGILLLGFDDGKPLSEECVSATKLLYLQPYSQGYVSIEKFETDVKNERFGLPVEYKVTTDLSSSNSMSGISGMVTQGETKHIGAQTVHWSRVIHIADGCVESDIYGTPRLLPVFNKLQDLDLTTGGSAEMFWRGAFPGMSFEAEADVDVTTSAADLDAAVEKYVHGLSRYMKLQGIKANQLQPNIASPKDAFDVTMGIIAGTTGIPKRILLGSEEAELASTMDRENWASRVDERRVSFAEPYILRAFIDRLIEKNVLPKPSMKKEEGATEGDEQDGEGSYVVEWPDISVVGMKEKSAVAVQLAQAMASYINGGGEAVMPPIYFLTEVLGFEWDKAEQILKAAEEMAADAEAENIENDLNPDGTPIEEEQVAGTAADKQPGKTKPGDAPQKGAKPPTPATTKKAKA